MILLISITVNAIAAGFDHSYGDYAKLLSVNVKDGRVDYKNIKDNPELLFKFLSNISKVSKEQYEYWSRNKRLSYLINLYNAYTIKLVVDNYPIKSIKDIKNPWGSEIVGLFGRKISLDSLENEVIRKEFKEPRVHFALVCAAKGCPDLSSEPYTYDNLDKNLDSAGTDFLMEHDKNYTDDENRTLYISPIFKWYEDDFKAKYGSVVKLLKMYWKGPGAGKIVDYKISYSNYDWALNNRNLRN